MVAVRCPRDLAHILRRAGGVWEPGSRRWLVQRRRIGPVIRALEQATGRPPIRRIASVPGVFSNFNHAPPALCCALCELSGQRYVVFFRGSSAQMEDAAQTVLVGAASSEFGKPAADIAAVLTVPPRSEQSRERERDNYWRFDSWRRDF